MIITFINEMPGLEISKISGWVENNELIDALIEKSMFETRQELYNILNLEHSPMKIASGNCFEYLSRI